MSEQMKTVPFSDLITEEALGLINREWIKRRAELSTNPIEYISGVVRDLAAIALEIKSASLSMPMDDFELLKSVAPEPVAEMQAGLISKETARAELNRRELLSQQSEESSKKSRGILPSIRRFLEKTGLFRASSANSAEGKS